ncbi:hypothetical protein KC348_g9939 [Hortaea werneckii]|nr:hypothetical protein KC350_g9031 [Hortaea werneckii]KAI6921993.1 hypothetical protein KC348_g9939 [Hortaea werneckii]
MSHPSPSSTSTTTTTTTAADPESGSPVESFSAMRIHDGTSTSTPLPKAPAPLMLPRPDMSARSATDPSPSALLQNYFASTVLHEQPPLTTRRNRSPYSRSHLRSRSGGSSGLSAPPITRAKSLPTQHAPRASSTTPDQSSSESTRSNSGSASPAFAAPLHDLLQPIRKSAPPARKPPPLPKQQHQPDPTTTHINTLIVPPHLPAIRPTHPQTSPNGPPSTHPHQRQPSLDRFRDEPHPTTTTTTTTPPTLHHYASTSSFTSSSISVPSTPTSARSRSPSISSLETIEDAPDLESEAVEVERKIAAERAARIARGEEVAADEEGSGGGLWRRRSLDAPGGSGSSGRGGVGGRIGAGGSGGGGGMMGGTTTLERKRWSICGGERRADLDLETIWED